LVQIVAFISCRFFFSCHYLKKKYPSAMVTKLIQIATLSISLLYKEDTK
jgi:hypothetical protein